MRPTLDGRHGKNMPPITCDTSDGPSIKSMSEYAFKTLIENRLVHSGFSGNANKFTHWGIPDLTTFCNEILCGRNRKGGSPNIVTGDSRSLCIVYVLEIRCREQTKMQSDQGKSLTLQCFLAQQRSHDLDKYLSADILPLFDRLREGVAAKFTKEHSECGRYRLPDGRCDFSAVAEQGFLRDMKKDLGHGRDGKQACEQFNSAPSKEVADLQHFTGAIATAPLWLTPPLKCDSEQALPLHVLTRARKLRVHFMQSSFLKMENEVFHGSTQWLERTINRYLPATFRKPAVEAGSQDATDDSDGGSEADGPTKNEYNRNEVVRDQGVLASLHRRMDRKSDFWSPTLSGKELTGWEYERAMTILPAHETPDKYSYAIDPMVHKRYVFSGQHNDEVDTFKAPQVIGRTRWWNYLAQPERWEKDFWRLLSPANFERIKAQQKETKLLCERLRMKNEEVNYADYRAPISRINEDFPNTAENVNYFTESSVCSVAMINTRIHAAKAALRAAKTPLHTNDVMQNETITQKNESVPQSGYDISINHVEIEHHVAIAPEPEVESGSGALSVLALIISIL